MFNAVSNAQRRSVGPLMSHGINNIRNSSYLGEQTWNHPLRSRVTACPVSPKMMVQNNPADRIIHADRLSKAISMHRMLFNDCPFSWCQGSFLFQDGFRNIELTDIVEQCSHAQQR